MKRIRGLSLGLLGGMLLAVLFVSTTVGARSFDGTRQANVMLIDDPVVQDELSLTATSAVTPAYCRLGVGGSQRPLTDYPVDLLASLRADWFINWLVAPSYLQHMPNDMRYAPSIYVKQWKEKNGNLVLVDWQAPYAEPYTYTIDPPLSTLAQLATQYPGRLWLAGNEIERRDWQTSGGGSAGQNEILPEVYARAYHDIYTTIKAADPTAKVANGSIILPSPLRLEYMTRMWDAYDDLYNAPMPVDVWQIHLYLLQEDDEDIGAGIPAGINATEGLYADLGYPGNILINKDFSEVLPLVQAFRTWMKEHGQQDKPLILSEYGINFPDWVIEGEFDPEDVRNDYLVPTLQNLVDASDPTLGYPADDHRLVQSIWWWSLDWDAGEYDGGTFFQYYNGNLLWSGYNPSPPHPMGLSTLGGYWIDAVAANLTEEINLKPMYLEPQSPVYAEAGQPVTVTLALQLANAGNVAVTQPFSVTLTDAASSQELGAFTVDGPVEGCGGWYKTTEVLWLNVTPGPHDVLVTVDDTYQIAETNESDNVATFTILVATHQVRLPVVLRR